MTGTSAVRESARTFRASAIPSSPGIMMSETIRSGGSAAMACTAYVLSAKGKTRYQRPSSCVRYVRSSGLSSTTASRGPEPPAGCTCGDGAGCRRTLGSSGALEAGLAPATRGTAERCTVKVVPRPGSLSTAMRPPCSVTSCFTMLSPMPVPVNRRVEEDSTWTNRSKIRSTSCGAIPIPWSATVIQIPSRSLPTATFTAQLVADVGEELALQAIQLAQPLVRLLQVDAQLHLAEEEVRHHPVADAGDQRGVHQQHEVGGEMLRPERLVGRQGHGEVPRRKKEGGDDYRHQRSGEEDRDAERDQVVGKNEVARGARGEQHVHCR